MELGRLDDRILADLGMARADIDEVVERLSREALAKRAVLRARDDHIAVGIPAAMVNWGTLARTAHLHA